MSTAATNLTPAEASEMLEGKIKSELDFIAQLEARIEGGMDQFWQGEMLTWLRASAMAHDKMLDLLAQATKATKVAEG